MNRKGIIVFAHFEMILSLLESPIHNDFSHSMSEPLLAHGSLLCLAFMSVSNTEYSVLF